MRKPLTDGDWLSLGVAGLCLAVGLSVLWLGHVSIADDQIAKTFSGEASGPSAQVLGYMLLLGSYFFARHPLALAGHVPLEVTVLTVLLGLGYFVQHVPPAF